MDTSDQRANERKREMDRLAGNLLSIDHQHVKEEALRAMELMREQHALIPRVAVCGGAGSGKTTFSEALGEHMSAPTFCVDEFIKGGWTPNHKEYRYRFVNGLVRLWDAMPGRGGWVIEHVEACHPDVVTAFKPNYAVLVEQDIQSLLRTAGARDLVSGSAGSLREVRALDSALIARRQFDSLDGHIIGNGDYWRVKKLIHP